MVRAMSKGNPRIISRVTAEEKAEFERLAEQRGTTTSEWIRDFVRAKIKRLSRSAAA
jgi:hypothetical protein